MKNVLVVFGGKSCEHDISIISALQMMDNMRNRNIIPIYISEKNEWFTGKELFNIETFKNKDYIKLKRVAVLPNDNRLYIYKRSKLVPKQKIDFAFIIMHGLNGEDGTMQGLFELANIPYSSSAVLSSSVGMDKEIMKKVFKANNIPVIDYLSFNEIAYKNNKKYVIDEIVNNIEAPYIIKPANLGSSIGISVCSTEEELISALDVAFNYDNKVVVEKAIERMKEINISVMGVGENIELSETEEPISWNKFLSFDEKYIKGGLKSGNLDNMTRIMPAKITKKEQLLIQDLSKKAFTCLNCSGLVRFDFIYDKEDKKIYLNEVNIIPGSNAYYLWDKKYSYTQLIDKIEDIGIFKHKEKNNKTYSYTSVVLKQNGGIKK